MLDCLIDAILDTLKLIPFLFLTFIILEFIEHKLSNKSQKKLVKYKKAGPIIGGLLGGIPECGFSAMASSLFSSRVITMGTIIAIFLSTSDEMLPVMISEQVSPLLILKIIGFKIIIGILIGLIVDLIYKSKTDKNHEHIHDLCDDEHCHCEKDGILKSSLKHTINTVLFVLIANLLINFAIYFIGEDTITKLLESKNILVYFASSLIGLIPNCAASILITEMYISNLIPIGVTISGLLTGSGIGILLLFKSNKNIKENISILSIIYFVGIIVGILVDLII